MEEVWLCLRLEVPAAVVNTWRGLKNKRPATLTHSARFSLDVQFEVEIIVLLK